MIFFVSSAEPSVLIRMFIFDIPLNNPDGVLDQRLSKKFEIASVDLTLTANVSKFGSKFSSRIVSSVRFEIGSYVITVNVMACGKDLISYM